MSVALLVAPGPAEAARPGATAPRVAAPAGAEVPAGLAEGAVIPGRWIVRFADGVDPQRALARVTRQRGVPAGRAVRAVWHRAIRAAAVTMSPAEAAALARRPEVVAVEPDRVVGLPPDARATAAAAPPGAKRAAGSAAAGPGGAPPVGAAASSAGGVSAAAAQVDPPWGLDRIDTRCTSRAACTSRFDGRYRYTSSGGQVTVYVLDTGIRATHHEFRTSTGASRVVAQVNTTLDGRDHDCNGHGTHVAGTIGGRTSGVAKNVRFRIVKVLDCAGRGSFTSVIAGLDWVRAQHRPGTRAVLNMSLGGSESPSLDAAVRAVIAAGISVVVASGNSGTDACETSPARVAEAVTVNAAERWDKDASFSNGGPCTDLHAPGVGIRSAWHTSDTAASWKSGTSMAAPHVAGCAARLLTAQPMLRPAGVQSTLKARASTDALTFPYGFIPGTPNRLLYCRPDW